MLDPIQQGFHETHALQCGFCTPGMLMTSRALLDENPNPTELRRSGRRSPARSVAARATRTSSPRFSGRRSTRPRRNRRYEDGHSREPPERDAGTADRVRAAQAQGGRALHPRQGQLPGRHQAAGHGARRHPAQPVRARAHRLDRHQQGARASGCGRGRHGQGPRDARAGVDAHDLVRHAGGARGRQGPLPGSGGRVRDRDRRVHRARRAPADRRRVRAAAGDRERAEGSRRGRPADP